VGPGPRLQRHQEVGEALHEAAQESAGIERRRIAGEVHDRVLPGLTGLAYGLDAARLGRALAGEQAALLDDTARGVRASIGELRALLADLSPSRLSEAPLERALGELTGRMTLSGVEVELRTGGLDGVHGPAADLVYRCAQETLRNVAAHSRATHVDLTVLRDGDGDGVTLTIDDDGCGFDEVRLARSGAAGHLGLQALGGLIADAGGTLAASSAPGQGTRVLATVPVRALGDGLPVAR
jgi:signal transduction histidine kinase